MRPEYLKSGGGVTAVMASNVPLSNKIAAMATRPYASYSEADLNQMKTRLQGELGQLQAERDAQLQGGQDVRENDRRLMNLQSNIALVEHELTARRSGYR